MKLKCNLVLQGLDIHDIHDETFQDMHDCSIYKNNEIIVKTLKSLYIVIYY